jgi:tRNA threonylcarbamoyladenosine biosynthesis protein TsaE
MKLILTKLEDLPNVASEFIKSINGQKKIAFYGEMGVGKTTFIKEICRHIGVMEVVTSPTFSIINEYHTENNEEVYHFDFYRINKLEELFDLGYEDYLYSPHYCLIEWPEKGENVLPEHILKVTISEMPDGIRIIEF